MSKPLEPRELVGHVAAALIRLGFRPAFKSKTGSRYLRYPGTPFQIRISDHRYSNFSAMSQSQVVKPVALRPIPIEEVPALALELAVRFLVRCDDRRGALRD